MVRLFSWMPRGRALPAEVWSARHRGLLLVLRRAPRSCCRRSRSRRAGRSARRGPSTRCPPLFGALACVRQLQPHRALVAVRDGAADLQRRARRRLARDDGGALPLLRDGRRARALRGVRGRTCWRSCFVVFQHGAMGAIRAETVFHHMHDPWRWAGIHGLFVAALAVTNVVSWRENERGRAATAASEERFRRAFDDAPVPMALLSPDGRVLQGNTALRVRTGYRHGRGPVVLGLRARRRPRASCARTGRRPPTPSAATSRADGSIGWIHWRHSLVLGPDGQPDHYVSQGVDITERKRDAERLDHQAHHDPLTGLPNRARFDRAARRRARARRGPGRGGLRRHRRLQGHQRLARASHRRRAAQGRRRPPDARSCAPTTCSPASAATSS